MHPIYLPPHAVSIPRTEVPMEDIIGVQVKPKGTQLQRDYSCRMYICREEDTQIRFMYLHFLLIIFLFN